MFGLGSLIGGAIKGAASIFGGIKASRAMKAMEKSLNNQMTDLEMWKDRRYNEDATQRADAQRMIALTKDNLNAEYGRAAGTAAVMGGTEESLAATKAANANALADTASRIAVAGANRKDQIENQYMAKKDNLNQQLNNLRANKANNIINAVNGVGSAASDVASSFADGDISGSNKIKAGAVGSSTGAGQSIKNIQTITDEDLADYNIVKGSDGRFHVVR